MGPTAILEMARAYGLRPRLWFLFQVGTDTLNARHEMFCFIRAIDKYQAILKRGACF